MFNFICSEMKDLSTSILKIRTVKPTAIAPGSMLVAEPFLSESYFNHGVITLVDYADDGALGLVMNNQTQHRLDAFVDGVDEKADVPVYCGGPIGQDRMVFMHTLGDKVFSGAREFAPGLYLGGDFDEAIDYVNSGYPTEGVLRFFIGYSGWDSGQLEAELDNDTWAVTDAPTDLSILLSGDADAYWHKFVRRMGEDYRAWRFFPRNVLAN